MTKQEATEWVKEYGAMEEDVEFDEGELEEAFRAIFGRPSDAEDREGEGAGMGRWSDLCAAVLK